MSGKVRLGEAVRHVKDDRAVGADAVAQHILAPGDPFAGLRGHGAGPGEGDVVAVHCRGQIKGRIGGRGDGGGDGAGGFGLASGVNRGHGVAVGADLKVKVVILAVGAAGDGLDQGAVAIDLVAKQFAGRGIDPGCGHGGAGAACGGAGCVRGIDFLCGGDGSHGHIVHQEDEGVVGHALDAEADVLPGIGAQVIAVKGPVHGRLDVVGAADDGEVRGGSAAGGDTHLEAFQAIIGGVGLGIEVQEVASLGANRRGDHPVVVGAVSTTGRQNSRKAGRHLGSAVGGQVGKRRSGGAGVEDHVSHGGIDVRPAIAGHAVGSTLIHVHQGPGIEGEREIGIGLKAIAESGRRRRGLARGIPIQMHVVASHSRGEVRGRIPCFGDFRD